MRFMAPPAVYFAISLGRCAGVYQVNHWRVVSFVTTCGARYSDKGDHLLVSLKYLARNGFGAMRLHAAVAKVGLDGTIITLMGNTQL